ncbi:hypothetical protein M3Y99_00038100 [Aphelenchoides fujianensis]|nr:hypothetical protein M3Y99_00038100 [Aphelenchoides fujianensis]
MKFALAVLLAVGCFQLATAEISVRSVAVKGVLKCATAPASDVKEILDTRTSGPSGLFEATGNTNGRPLNETGPRPGVAEDTKKGQTRSFQLAIPRDYVKLGKTPRTFDVGTLNLELSYPKGDLGEGRQALNSSSSSGFERGSSLVLETRFFSLIFASFMYVHLFAFQKQ